MMGLLMLLGVVIQPQIVLETYDWATDVLVLQWIDPNTTQVLEVPPAQIKRYRVRCGQTAGSYTETQGLAPDQLIVGFRMLIKKPKVPTRWYCRADAIDPDGTVIEMSPEQSFIVQ